MTIRRYLTDTITKYKWGDKNETLPTGILACYHHKSLDGKPLSLIEQTFYYKRSNPSGNYVMFTGKEFLKRIDWQKYIKQIEKDISEAKTIKIDKLENQKETAEYFQENQHLLKSEDYKKFRDGLSHLQEINKLCEKNIRGDYILDINPSQFDKAANELRSYVQTIEGFIGDPTFPINVKRDGETILTIISGSTKK